LVSNRDIDQIIGKAKLTIWN